MKRPTFFPHSILLIRIALLASESGRHAVAEETWALYDDHLAVATHAFEVGVDAMTRSRRGGA